MPNTDVQSVIDQLERTLLDGFRQARDVLVLSALELELLRGSIEGALRQIGMQAVRTALAEVQRQLDVVRQIGWEELLSELPAAARPVGAAETLAGAEIANPALRAAITTQDLSRIQGISAETEQAIRDAIARGLADNIHPTTLARTIRTLIGLNRRQVQAVANYRAKLMTQDRDPAQVERMVARYTQRQLNLRSQAIARTEVLRAQNSGRVLQAQRLVAEGTLSSGEWSMMWSTAHDERLCPQCAPLDGQRVPIGGMFLTVLGPVQAPPLHPLCRCGIYLTSNKLITRRS